MTHHFPTACELVTDDNLRIMLCPTCGSEGRLIYAYRNDPENERYEECPECEGACVVLVEVEPIDMEDLEVAYG
jgi:Zn finger protein HypA/HybF involved in hydrogenase expression